MSPARLRPTPGVYPVSGGEAELLADADRADAWLLSVDNVPQSHVDLADPTYLEFEYVRLMGDVVDCMTSGGDPVDAVHIGGAACTLPRYVAATRPGSRQVVFEPDAELLRLVREQLALKTVRGLKVCVDGGRTGVAALPEAADDLLVLDAFTGSAMPAELATEEFVRDAARVLRHRGIYLVNVVDGPGLIFARRMAATIRSVFPHSLLLVEPGVLRGRRFGNVVIAASRSGLPVGELTRRGAGGIVRARCIYGDELARFCSGASALRDGAAVPVPAPSPRDFS